MIRDILFELASTEFHNGKKVANGKDGGTAFVAIDKAEKAIRKAVMEDIIEEDEKEEVDFGDDRGLQTDLTLVIRNQLKAEQRQRANKLFGRDK